jgi:hypothetical protein
MSFTDDDIRTIVETACYSDPRVTDYMTATLIQRRDKIGRVFFSKVLPLDHFRVQNGELQFDDLAVVYGFKPAAQYTFRWSLFDNITQQHYAVNADSSNRLPAEARQAGAGTYFSALIQSPADGQKYVLVTIRKDTNGFKVVGVERAW